MLALRGDKVESDMGENWTDYCIYKETENGKPNVLLHGLFLKNDNGWKFSEALAFGSVMPTKSSVSNESNKESGFIPWFSQTCKDNLCVLPIPKGVKFDIYSDSNTCVANCAIADKKSVSYGLGTSNCRFPSIVTGGNLCWVSWEENGNIILSSINPKTTEHNIFYVERDQSDSFNPVIAKLDEDIWVFYLNDRNNYYSLYARYYDGSKLSDEILISDNIPVDVFTPAVTVSSQNKMIVLWSEWKANNRELKYRYVDKNYLSDIYYVRTKSSGINYTCAWSPSIIFDSNSQPWGAWNQHYPATLGVYAGNLLNEAYDVTESKNINDFDECGGYPTITLDNTGKIWVFWESFMWNTVKGKPQRILARYYDPQDKKWSLKYFISSEKQTLFNQTPKVIMDKTGIVWVVWSGKKNEHDSWAVYLSYLKENKWSSPIRISPNQEAARAPSICTGDDGSIWIAWHSGCGENMTIKILNYRAE